MYYTNYKDKPSNENFTKLRKFCNSIFQFHDININSESCVYKCLPAGELIENSSSINEWRFQKDY